MEEISPIQLQKRIKELEKQNRVLQKKLKRSEANRTELENSYEIQNKLVNQTIQGLEKSRSEAEKRGQELQDAFNNLQIMQTKLVEAEKMSALGVLVAGIAHEINNPITFISANVDYARTYIQDVLALVDLYQDIYPDPDPRITALMTEKDLEFVAQDILRVVKSMRVGSDRICDIVTGLRTFSRLDEADCKDADLHDGLESSLMILQHRLKANEHRSKIDIIRDYGALPLISCFAGQLNQVFLNILTNAIDAIEAQSSRCQAEQKEYAGCITINTSLVESQWVKIVISDNGEGMQRDIQAKIFDPFFTTKPVGRGTGLGMSVSYKIVVENHGGRLTCSSLPGIGSTFVMLIPLKPMGNDLGEAVSPAEAEAFCSLDRASC